MLRQMSSFTSKLITAYSYTYQHRAIVIRALFCWVIGVFLISTDELNNYDARLNIRGQQNFNNELVVVELDQKLFYNNELTSMKESSDISDNYYWDRSLWMEILETLLKANPKKIAVTLTFSESIGPLQPNKNEFALFSDDRIYWAAKNKSDLTTPSSWRDRSHLASFDLTKDEDGLLRRYMTSGNLPEVLAEYSGIAHSRLLNFRGKEVTNQKIKASDLINHKVSLKSLENKIIIIGLDKEEYLTPIGPLSRADLVAHIVDNISHNRWITRGYIYFYAVELLVVLLLTLYMIMQFPQSIAFVLVLWITTLQVALSIWVFDTFRIWLPIFSACIQIFSTWSIFIGYQANRIEQKNWQLQQEKNYLKELEQLKNNFVSLISHDLKTPIAKIQAIIDRLMTQNPQSQLFDDFKSLRFSSEELNKYIQSIIQVLRVESRDFKVNMQVGDINETIEEAVRQLLTLAKEKSIQIRTELEPMFSTEFDFILIKEVLINLIENAIKYTPEGGTILVRSAEAENEIRVEVHDNGNGIPEQEIEHIWGKFVRGKDQDLKTKGTGLGLYLVKYFIELHNGRVSIESLVGQGTKVSFTLPIEVPAELPEKENT